MPSCVLKPGAVVGGDPEGGRRQTPTYSLVIRSVSTTLWFVYVLSWTFDSTTAILAGYGSMYIDTPFLYGQGGRNTDK